MKPSSFFLIFSLALFGSSTSLQLAHADPPDATTPPLDIVYIGDSITAGAGLNQAKGDLTPPAACSAALRKWHFQVYDSNQGHSGHTTKDFLPPAEPNPKCDFDKATTAAAQLVKEHPGTLIFSIMLGTNDSAQRGPNGAPLSPEGYHDNLKAIIDRLIHGFPYCTVYVQHPTWYSPSTHNSSEYGPKGLERLKSYDPVIHSLVEEYQQSFSQHDHARISEGDQAAFGYFEAHYAEVLRTEKGADGPFYLHPNKEGAVKLGEFWAKVMAPHQLPVH